MRATKKVVIKTTKLSATADNLPMSLQEIINLLKINPTQKYIIEKTGKNKSNVYRALNNLTKKGYILKLDRGVYKVVSSSGPLPPSCHLEYWRLHALMVKLHVSSVTHGIIKSTVFKNSELYNLRSTKIGHYFDCGVTAQITKESIYLRYPQDWEVRFKSQPSLISGIYDIVKNACVKIEDRFKINVFKDDRINFEIVNCHVAYVQGELVKDMEINKVNGVIVKDDDDGKARFLIDWSKGFPEIEMLHPIHSLNDTELWQSFLGILKDGTLLEIAKEFKELKFSINDLNKMNKSIEEIKFVLMTVFKPMFEKSEISNDAQTLPEDTNRDKPYYVG